VNDKLVVDRLRETKRGELEAHFTCGCSVVTRLREGALDVVKRSCRVHDDLPERLRQFGKATGASPWT